MDATALWKSVYTRFDPLSPPERVEWRVDRTRRGLYALHTRLNLPFETQTKILLAGTMGAGKSTELIRLAEQRQEREFVVFFDVHRHMTDVVGEAAALESLAPWEVCVLVALATARALAERYPQRWAPAKLAALGDAWLDLLPGEQRPQIDIGQLARTLTVTASSLAGAGPALTTLAGAVGALRWNARLGRRGGQLTDQDPRVRFVVAAAADLLRHAAELEGRPVLVLLDGLDRLGGAPSALARAEALFVRSTLLQSLPCRMVVTAPFALRHHTSFAEARGFHPHVLVNEPVLDPETPEDPARPGEGIDFFERLFACRVADLEAQAGHPLIEPDALRRLAWCSGGRARDFVTFVQESAGHAYAARLDRITAEVAARVLDEQRRLRETGIYREHVEVLRAVRSAPHDPLPRSEYIDELLAGARLLPYPNHSEWFYPHPLLFDRLAR